MGRGHYRRSWSRKWLSPLPLLLKRLFRLCARRWTSWLCNWQSRCRHYECFIHPLRLLPTPLLVFPSNLRSLHVLRAWTFSGLPLSWLTVAYKVECILIQPCFDGFKALCFLGDAMKWMLDEPIVLFLIMSTMESSQKAANKEETS